MKKSKLNSKVKGSDVIIGKVDKNKDCVKYFDNKYKIRPNESDMLMKF